MKLSLKIGLVTALAAGMIAVGISLNHSFWEGKAWRAELKSHAGTMSEMLNLSVQESMLRNDFSALELYLNQFSGRKDLAYVVIYDNVATPLARTGGQASREAIDLYQVNPNQHRKDIHSHVITGKKIYEQLVPVIVEGQTWGMLQVGFYEDEILSIYHRTNTYNYLILFLGLAVCLAAGWGVARYLGKPIEALIDGADQLVKSNYDHRIKIRRKDELGRLVSAFNQMAGTIRQDVVELESKNRQLLKAQERQIWLARIAEQVGEGVAVCDLEGILTFVNHSWAAMHGYAPEQLLGKHLSISHSHSQLEREVLPFNQKVMQQGLNSGIVGHIKKDRTVFYTEMTTTLLKNTEGEPIGFIGVARDITEQKKAQDELKKERDLIKSIFAVTPDAVIITDLNGNFTDVNDKAIKLLGLEARDSLLGKNFSLFIAPDDRGLALHNFQKTLDYGGVSNIQLNVVNARNEQFTLEYSTSLLHGIEGRPTNIVAVGRDVSIRRKAEQALAESEEKYRGLIEATDTGFVIIDGSGRVIDANLEYIRLTGRSSHKEILGHAVTEWTARQDMERNRAAVEACAKNGFVRGLVITYAHPDGTEIPIEINANVVHAGSELRIVTLCRDISSRIQAEKAVRDLNQRFEYALGATKAGFDIIDAEFNIQYIDPEWKKFYGDPSGRKCYEYFMNRDQACATCGIKEAFREKKSVITEEYLEREKRWVEVHTIPFQNADGKWLVAEFNIDINDRKLNEQKLKDSEQKYRELADTLPQTVFESDLKGDLVYVNRTGFEQFGYEEEDFVKRLKIMDMLVPQDRVRAGQNMARRLKGGPPENQEYQALRKDGGTFPISIYANTVIEGGSVRGLRGVIVDVSEKKKGEQILKESEARFRALAEASPAGIFAYREKFIYANPACQPLTGYSPAELSNLNFWELIHPDHREMVKQRGLARQRGEKVPSNYEFKMIRKDGQVRWVDFAGSLAQFDGQLSGLGMALDITERKSIEEILQASETQYRTTIDSIGDAIHVVDADLNIILANATFKKWCQQFNLGNEPVGKNVFEVCPFLSSEVRREYQQVFKTGQPFTSQEGNTVLGEVLFTETSKIPVFEGSKVTRVITVVRDVTERKHADGKLAESEAKYRTLFDQASDGIMFMSADGKHLMVNDSFAQMHGYGSSAEMEHISLEDLDTPETAKLAPERLRRMMAGETLHFEVEHFHRDGHRFLLQVSCSVIQMGGQSYFLGFHQDITERNAMVKALSESETKYRQIFEGVAEGVYRTTPEGKIQLANQAIVKMLGYDDLNDLMNRDIEKEGYVDNADREKFIDEMNRNGQVKNWVSEWRKKDGSVLIARENSHVVKDQTGKIIYYEGTVEDITEQKQAERKLAESERKYSQIFEDIVEGVYRTTPSGKVLLANPALVRMLGFETMDQLIKLDLNKSGYMDHSTRDRFKELMERNGQVMGFEARWKRPDGKVLIISENARAVKDSQGKVQYYEGTIEDITERQKAQEELLNEKNKLSDLFRVSLQVARAGDVQKKMDLTMEGIAGTDLFARAVMVLKNENGSNSHISHFGMTDKEVRAILKAGPAKAESLERIFNKKYRYSNSYFIPHDAEGVDFSVKLINKKYQPSGDWHSDDVLLVPLVVKDKHIGYLTVDEPVDGKIPNLETVRLLELFAYQAAVAIDNLRLYSDLERSYYSTLKAFVAAMDAKDPYTKGHSENVRYHALNIARQLKLPDEQVKLIDFSSLLHDIGKLAIRDEILTKPSLLSDHEYQEVKLHPVIGSHLVSEVESLIKVAPIIHSHHEHFDGSGYPRGIKGDQIPLEARIIAVADAFEAMTSDRPYRKAFDYKVAIKRLKDAAGTQFDNEIVSVFIKLHQEAHG